MPKRNRHREMKKQGLPSIKPAATPVIQYKSYNDTVAEGLVEDSRNKKIGQALTGRKAPSEEKIIQRIRRQQRERLLCNLCGAKAAIKKEKEAL